MCWKPDPPRHGTKVQQCRCCSGGPGHVIECRSILGTTVRISTHSPWYMAEGWRFGSEGSVVWRGKMHGYLTPETSIRFCTGWRQGDRGGKLAARNDAGEMTMLWGKPYESRGVLSAEDNLSIII